MDRIGKTLILAMGGLLLTGAPVAVFGDTAENPYRVIAERNAFDLKPYQEPPGPKVPDAPMTDLKLSGFTKIGNIKRVLLVGMNPKEPGRLVYYEIEERVSQDGIEVLEIDELNGKVKIRRGGGAELELNYDKNGMSPTKTPAPGPAQPNPAPGAPGFGRPGMPGAVNPPNSGATIVGKNNTAANPSPYFQPAANTANLAATTAANPVDTSRSGLRQIPTRQVRTAPMQAPSNLSPEEQVIVLEAQRMKAAQQGVVLPPTPGIPSIPSPSGAPGIPPN